GIAPERVDHRAAHAALRERLELDAAGLVEAERRVDQPEHTVLDQVAELDRVRHRGGDAARQRFHEREAGGDAIALTGDERLTLHFVGSFGFDWMSRRATAIPTGKRMNSEAWWI